MAESHDKSMSGTPGITNLRLTLEEDRPGQTSFKTYLRGELETYSDRTLGLLWGDIQQMTERGENWAERTYSELVRELGYRSLVEAEEMLRKKAPRE